MKIKKFMSTTFKDALDEVKRDLGPDAIIISSKTVDRSAAGTGRMSGVEVTAAVEEDDGTLVPVKGSGGKGAIPDVAEILKEVRAVSNEIGYLKEIMKPIIPVLRVSEDKKGLFNLLVKNGVDIQLAVSLLEKCENSLQTLRKVMAGDLKMEAPIAGREKGLIFLGPPGVGKTASLTKIAHKLVSGKKRVNLISLDSNRVGSVAYMKSLSEELGCRLSMINRIEELPGAFFKDVSENVTLVDTPGNDYEAIIERIRTLIPSFPLRKCFLLEATMNAKAAMKLWNRCGPGDIVESIGFTKLDLAPNFGTIYNITRETGKPLSFVTTGMKVPQDIRVPTPDYLAGLITGGYS